MKNRNSFIAFALVLSLFFAGCGVSAPAETTVPTTVPAVTAPPPETTSPEETASPAETTAPPETTLPPETIPPTTEPTGLRVEDSPFHETFLADGFEHYDGQPVEVDNSVGYYLVFYLYTGESPEIELSALGVTLTLPEEWLDQVYVFQVANPIGSSMNGYAYIVSRNVMEAHQSHSESNDKLLGVQDYLFSLSSVPLNQRESYAHSHYLGETEDHVVFAGIIDASNATTGLFMHQELIGKIGQEAYDALVGDLIVTRENIRNFVTIHNETIPSE